MTKQFFLAIPFLVAGPVSVAAYIDDSMMRKYSASYTPTKWSSSSGSWVPSVQPTPSSSKRATRSVKISSPTILDPTSSTNKPANVDVDDIIRAEYEAWADRHGKTKERKRYEIFRANFIHQMDFNRKTGQFYLLNEFGDLTAKEYAAMTAANSREGSTATRTSSGTLVSDSETVGLDDASLDYDLGAMESMETGSDWEDADWREYSFAMDFTDGDYAMDDGGFDGEDSMQDSTMDTEKGFFAFTKETGKTASPAFVNDATTSAATSNNRRGATMEASTARRETMKGRPTIYSLGDISESNDESIFSKMGNTSRGAFAMMMASFVVSAAKLGQVEDHETEDQEMDSYFSAKDDEMNSFFDDY
mmetsp:Transcript_4415/g.8136  ORF Transcript_4415/g.8136 Transcript_4415/m.8136 type:complete len:362 (+) Transcript_4415:2-1087(+)